MATMKFSGTIMWPKLKEPDTAFGRNSYRMDLILKDEEEIQKFKSAGLELKLKEKPGVEGKFISLNRDHEKQFRDELVVFGPPKVYDGRGQPNNDGTYPELPSEILVGNGSKGTAKISIYENKKTGRNGHRLEAVLVTELVEYNKSNNGAF